MKLLLKQDVESLGMRGEIVEVARGYGRNYLVPKGFALEATESNVKLLKQEKRRIEAILVKELEKAESLAAEIKKITVKIAQRAGEDDKLYGSVTNIDIAKKLAEQNVEVDRKKILLEEPIKSLGEHKVDIKIHPRVTATITVLVEKEE